LLQRFHSLQTRPARIKSGPHDKKERMISKLSSQSIIDTMTIKS
jgi:hypothetical protein